MPVFDMIETVLVKKLRFPPSLGLRIISRSLYVGTHALLELICLLKQFCTLLFSIIGYKIDYIYTGLIS